MKAILVGAVILLLIFFQCCPSTDYESAPSEPQQPPPEVPTAPRPSPTPIPPPPAPAIVQQFTGAGDHATDFFPLNSGLAKFHLTHDGQRNFIIHLLDTSGNTMDYLANEIGPYDASTAIQIRESGNYMLDIDADGNWTIIIEQ